MSQPKPVCDREIKTRPLNAEDHATLSVGVRIVDEDGTTHTPTLEEMNEMGWGRITAARNILTGEGRSDRSLAIIDEYAMMGDSERGIAYETTILLAPRSQWRNNIPPIEWVTKCTRLCPQAAKAGGSV